MAAEKFDFSLKCLKYLLCTVNIIFMFFGTMLIYLAYLVCCQYFNFDNLLDASYIFPASLLFFAGSIIFMLSGFGFYAIIKENSSMIFAFTFMMFATFVVQIVAVLLAHVFQDRLSSVVYQNMHQLIKIYEQDQAAADAIDSLQYELSCCGITTKEDWAGILFESRDTYFEKYGIIYPDSCGALRHNKLQHSSRFHINDQGCLTRLEEILSDSITAFTICALAISFVQLAYIWSAMTLGKAIKRQKVKKQLNQSKKLEGKKNFILNIQDFEKNVGYYNPPVINEYSKECIKPSMAAYDRM